jgi:hypothetical protein
MELPFNPQDVATALRSSDDTQQDVQAIRLLLEEDNGEEEAAPEDDA